MTAREAHGEVVGGGLERSARGGPERMICGERFRRRGSASGLRVLGKRRRRRLPIGVAGAGADPMQRPRRINEAVARGAQWR